MKLLFYIISIILAPGISNAQAVKLSCSEKERKNTGGEYPLLVKTCFIKNFKFVCRSYPDDDGRYFSDDHEVYLLKKQKVH
jgi:hypothetical protein